VLDFTSALYLGMKHPAGSLLPWEAFTSGVPAALFEPPEAKEVAQQVATLQGCERGLLGTSTLHLFWDFFGMFSRGGVSVYVDRGTYPIARWGVERAAGRGAMVREFAHHDPEDLQRSLALNTHGNALVVVLTDGFCPECGRPAPLHEYLRVVRSRGGWLVVDDTQALGIFGTWDNTALYGRGGGGMLPRLRISGPDLLVVSSLAKGFGTPVAVLSGSKKALDEFEMKSETRMHCSPPSLPVIRAAQHALVLNRVHGDRLRARLSSLVFRFRRRAQEVGVRCKEGLFPIQTLLTGSKTNTRELHERLARNGVRTVLRYENGTSDLRISFVITARHTPQEIDRAVGVLSASLCKVNELAM